MHFASPGQNPGAADVVADFSSIVEQLDVCELSLLVAGAGRNPRVLESVQEYFDTSQKTHLL